MMISTKGRYALRLMVDIAMQNSQGYIPLADIARRQDISEKYLESIVSSLCKKGLLNSIRGKGGGYKLNRPLEEYRVSDILLATEGSVAPVACLSKEVNDCPRRDKCTTLNMWKDLHKMINDYFSGISLQNLISGTD